jgi:hypothetical protein
MAIRSDCENEQKERTKNMKRKRRIGLLLCCLAVMGMFSASVIPAQAKAKMGCHHPHFMIVPDADCRSFSKADGHYKEFGTAYICADCKYTYWTNLYQVKMGDHDWYLVSEGADSNGNIVWRYHCRGCSMLKDI